MDLVIPLLGALKHVHRLNNPGFVNQRTEGAGVGADAAGDALTGIHRGLLVALPHGDGPGGAVALTGALVLHNSGIGTGRHASAADNAFLMVDHGLVVFNGDGPHRAGMPAPVGQTAPAGGPHLHRGDRTFVTGGVNDLHHPGVGHVPAHRQLDPVADDGPLLIDAAPELGLGPGDDLFRNVEHTGCHIALIGKLRHFPEHIVFQLLNFSLKLFHQNASIELAKK